MKSFSKMLRTLAAATLGLSAATLYAAAAPHYLITNNDNSRRNSATVYTILGDFLLKQKAVLNTGGTGINIASVHVTENSGSCSLNEDPRSPASDTNTITIESIGVYPPRPF
jgi:hypothetical protein